MEQHLKLFPTNLGIYQLDDFETINAELMSNSELSTGAYDFVKRENVWGLNDRVPAVKRLHDFMLECAARYAENSYNYEYHPEYFYHAEGWTQSTDAQDYNFFMHNHRMNHLSAVYYVNVDDKSGDIDFVDPRSNLGFLDLNNYANLNIHRVHPVPGMLVLFPGWLLHYVHPNKSNIIRQVIATNIKVKDEHTFYKKGFTTQTNKSSLKL